MPNNHIFSTENIIYHYVERDIYDRLSYWYRK